MKVEHHADEEIVAIQLVSGPDDYGREIAEGVYAHFRRVEGDEDILVRIEVYDFKAQGRDASHLEVERFGSETRKAGRVSAKALIDALENAGVVVEN